MSNHLTVEGAVTDHILQLTLAEFQRLKRLAKRAFAQLADEDFHRRTGDEQNSLAIIIQHLAGNMRSRWTDFLTTDGEKADRHRDTEFIDAHLSREALMQRWEEGWACLFTALRSLTAEDLSATIFIRKEPHSVFAAINRQTSHYAFHVGQIVLLAKQIKGAAWQSLSVPPGQSKAFNRSMGM